MTNSWRQASSLARLGSQLDSAFPNRDRTPAYSGIIGDAAHASRPSDHNPFNGVVNARDFGFDFGDGKNASMILDTLDHEDLNYIISNGKIRGRGGNWRDYTGPNAHVPFFHVSVGQGKSDGTKTGGDSDKNWTWTLKGTDPAPPQNDISNIPLAELVAAVKLGNYGNGQVRKERLGTRYTEVMNVINNVPAPTPTPSVDIEGLARAVIRGEYGDGQVRKDRLGDNYQPVQDRVNDILDDASPANPTYTVQPGDSLSGIAGRLRYNGGWNALYNKNRGVIGGNPNVIYAGQVLSL